jgi:hypothetical protein
MLVDFVVCQDNKISVCVAEVMFITRIVDTAKTSKEMVFELRDEVLTDASLVVGTYQRE